MERRFGGGIVGCGKGWVERGLEEEDMKVERGLGRGWVRCREGFSDV